MLQARWLTVSTPLRGPSAAAAEAEAYSEESKQDFKQVSQFQELVDYNMVHPNVINTITKGMGHTTMTEVQSQTINEALQGQDM